MIIEVTAGQIKSPVEAVWFKYFPGNVIRWPGKYFAALPKKSVRGRSISNPKPAKAPGPADLATALAENAAVIRIKPYIYMEIIDANNPVKYHWLKNIQVPAIEIKVYIA